MPAAAPTRDYWSAVAALHLLGAERTWLMHQAGSIAGEATLLVTPGTPVDIPWHSVVLQAGDRLVGGCVQARIDALPFVDGCWPRIVLQHALDVRDTPLDLLRESARILSPGGELLLFGFNAGSVWTIGRLGAEPAFRHAVRPHLPGRLRALLASLALTPVGLRGYGPRFAGRIERIGRGGGLGRALYVLRARKHSQQAVSLRGRRTLDVAVPDGLQPSATRATGIGA